MGFYLEFLIKLQLRNKTIKLFENLPWFDGDHLSHHHPTLLCLSYLSEPSYIFLAPVCIQSGNGKCAVLPFLDFK